MWMDLASFAGIMALGQMVPGPDWILVTRGALAHGMRTAVWTATGIACGLMVHAAVAVGGLAMYVRNSELAWSAMRWVAGGYLLWVAFSLTRESSRAGEVDMNSTVPGRPFLCGLACNLLNGKVCLFLAAVCASYLHGERPVYWPMILWSIIVIQGWVLWITWAALLRGETVREMYGRSRRWIDAAFAAGLVLLALRLFVAR
jgi:threonine/homoserine/homoserine lactone efflux protein